MKKHHHSTSVILAAAALVLAGAAQLQATPNFVVAAFATGTQGQPNGGQYSGDDISVPYGAGTIVWDGVTYDTADGSTGAAYITANFSSANNTDVLVSMGPGYNNWYYEGDSASCPTGTVDFTQYHAVQFDILYDTNSALTISQFNTGNNWPTNYLTAAALASGGSNYMATKGGYYTAGVNVDLFTGANGANVYLGTFQIPTNAASGWQTVTMPYSDTLSGITSGAGLWFQGSFGGGSGINGGPYNASFWIDNVVLVGNVTVAAPPTLALPTKSVPGLNVFASTEGNSFYDRQGVLLVPNSGLSWAGSTSSTPTYPVKYSFTLNSFPGNSTYGGEAYMFLVPNPVGQEGGPDYSEANCAIFEIQSTPNGGQGIFQIKVNEPGGNNMQYGNAPYTNAPGTWPGAATVALTNWFETGGLTNVQSKQLYGTWTLQFTTSAKGSLIAPDGTIANFTIPSYYATNFQENGSTATGFNIYLGMQANQASAMDQAVVYGSFALTNVGANFSENFVGETTLNTNNWNPKYAGGPAGVLIVPTNAPYWINWSLPSAGFTLTDSGSLATNAIWNNVSNFPPISMFGSNVQLISANDLPNGKAAYFELVKRTFSQLLVLLPGQTNAPNTTTGKVGTPAPFSLSASGGVLNFTVLAVDSHWNPVSGVNDTLSFTDTDGGIYSPPLTLANGTGTFSVFFQNTASNVTITASDTTTPTIGTNVSSAFTVGP